MKQQSEREISHFRGKSLSTSDKLRELSENRWRSCEDFRYYRNSVEYSNFRVYCLSATIARFLLSPKQIETLLIDEFPAPEKLKIVNFLSRNKTPASQAGDNLYAKRDEIQQSRDVAR